MNQNDNTNPHLEAILEEARQKQRLEELEAENEKLEASTRTRQRLDENTEKLTKEGARLRERLDARRGERDD